MTAFTAVIPLYDGSAFIAGALESVIAQTDRDWEAVVVDDGSPDGGKGAAIVAALAREHPDRSIRLIRQENKGLGGARNAAIRAATGRWLALLDQDDVWYPGKLARLREVAAADPAAAILCHDEAVRKDGAVVGVQTFGPADPDMFRAMLFGGNRLTTSGVAVRRDVLDAVGLFSEDRSRTHLVEDYDLWLRAAHRGFKFVFIPEALGESVLHGGNFSVQAEETMCRLVLGLMDEHYARLSPRGPLDAYRLRRQKARVWVDAAWLQLMRGSLAAGAASLARAGRWDPLLVDTVGVKLWRRLRRPRVRPA